MSVDLTNSINSAYTDAASTSSLEGTLAGSDLSTASDDKLMSVCKEFESYFVEQMYKGMEKMIPTDDDDDSSSSGSIFSSSSSSSTGTLTDYYKDEMISKYASQTTESNNGQGLGIAQTLYEQMKRNYSTLE